MTKSKTLNKTLKGFDQYLQFEGMFIPQQKMPTVKTLPPGIYRIFKTQEGKTIISPMSSMTDGLIDLPAHVSESVINEVNKFWSDKTRDNFDRFGMVYKRGILLYGPPGTGKTVIVSKVMEQVVREGGLVFFDTDPHLLYETVNLIKEIQNDIKILAVYEEFDSRLSRDSSFLSLLDGELQIENIVYLATTNYIERIPSRVKNRPSRFASVLHIDVPDAATRLAFLKGKAKDEPIDFAKWVELTDGMSLDHIKDLIISVLCIGLDLDVAAAKLKTMNSEEDGNSSNRSDHHGYLSEDDMKMELLVRSMKRKGL